MVDGCVCGCEGEAAGTGSVGVAWVGLAGSGPVGLVAVYNVAVDSFAGVSAPLSQAASGSKRR